MYYINIVWAECCIPPNLMGDHGTMARGTHAGVQDEGRQAASGIAFLVLSEMNAMAALMKDPGGGAGGAAALAQPVGRGGCGGVKTVGQRHDGRTQTAAGGERGTAPGERDSGDGFGFFAVRIHQDASS